MGKQNIITFEQHTSSKYVYWNHTCQLNISELQKLHGLMIFRL